MIGLIVGYVLGQGTGAVIGGIGGFVVVAMLWGIALGIAGFIRGVKKR